MISDNGYKYTVGANTDTPIMFIDAQIGMSTDDNGNWDGDAFIDAAVFARELMELDQLGKKEISVWICSEGGQIFGGQKIYSAILNSKTKVNTYNMGGCFSIAASLFQAGRKRYMADYSKMMLHPVQGTTDSKMYNSFTDSVVTMLCRRTNKSEMDIRGMMASTTWLNAEQCLDMGLCDEIVYSDELNKPRITTATNLKEAIQFATNKLNLNQSTIKMKKVTNRLKLNDDANEDSILHAISEIENKATTEITKLSNLLKAESDKSAKATSDLTALQNKYDAMEAENKTRIEAENKSKGIALAKKARLDGKIADTDEAENEWAELATANYEGTEKLVNTLAVNKVGKVLKVEASNDASKLGPGASMAATMAKIAAEKNKK